jgi:3-methyladenine DNA glycosylase AlkD
VAVTARNVADDLERRLREQADPARAEHEHAYLKSDLEHFGVSVPVTRRTVRAAVPTTTHRTLLALTTELWRRPIHECRLAAVEILTYHREHLAAADLEVIERFLRQAGTWAFVDPLAEAVAGDIVRRIPSAATVLDRWSGDADFWIRRSALLALLGPLRAGRGDLDRFSRYADSMLDEGEFFIRKAIGWVLRETGKKRPDWVAAWLADRPGRVPVLAVREAVKSLPEADRPAFIAAAARVNRPTKTAAGATSARAGTSQRRPR